jgi:hypothetical protein
VSRSRTLPTSNRRRKTLLAGAALVAVVGLSACNEAPGAAAYVGDTHISTEQVQDDGAEVIAAAGPASQTPLDGAEVNRRQVNRLVTQRLVEIAAERRGVTVSDSEVDALITQAVGTGTRAEFETQLAAAQLVPPSEIDTFARTVALNQKLAAKIAPGADEAATNAALVKELGALSEEIGTGVSPRFGTWVPSDLTVGLPPDDLSTPVPVVTPDQQVTTGSVQTD